MELYQFKLLLTTFLVLFPLFAQASEINMQSGKVKINRDSQGNITVETGKIKLNSNHDISIDRRNVSSAIRRKKINRLKRNCNKSSNRVVSQQITKIRGSNQRKNQTSIVSVSCR
jgi:Na+-transporting NADH:ubiquinone oxidoreductase subunit NqrF